MRALVFVLLVSCGSDCRSECEKRGGHVEERDCHDEYTTDIITIADGNGNTTTLPLGRITRQCDHVCVGAKP